MGKYDIESFCSDLESALKSNLNTKLSAIDTDKGDAITLRQFDSNAYFFQTMNQKIAAYDPFLFYEIGQINSQGIGPRTAKTYIVGISVCVADQGTDLKIANRLLRYQRALEEVIQDSWDQIGNGLTLRLESHTPVPIGDLNSSFYFQTIGVSIEVAIV